MRQSFEENNYRKVFLLGKEGSQKSSLFEHMPGTSKLLDEKYDVYENSDEKILFLNLPEVNIDIELSSSFFKIIEQAADFVQPFQKGLNLIIYCIPFKQNIEASDLFDLVLLKQLFGKEILSHICIAITYFIIKDSERPKQMDKWRKMIGEKTAAWDLDPLGQNSLLFFDFEGDFSKEFMTPFVELLNTTSFYEPKTTTFATDQPLLALRDNLFLKYLAHLRVQCEDKFKKAQYAEIFGESADAVLWETKLIILDILMKDHEETLDKLIPMIKKSSSPFLQQICDYFTSTNDKINLMQDLFEVLNPQESSNFQPKDQGFVEKIEEKLLSRILISLEKIRNQNFKGTSVDIIKIKRHLDSLKVDINLGAKDQQGIGCAYLDIAASIGFFICGLVRQNIIIIGTSTIGLIRSVYSINKGIKKKQEKEVEAIWEELRRNQSIKDIFLINLMIYFGLF